MRRAKPTWYYLHILNGAPAFFDGRQVCYMKHGVAIAASLAQIKAEQRASTAWRLKNGYSDKASDYGYRRLRLPKNC